MPSLSDTQGGTVTVSAGPPAVVTSEKSNVTVAAGPPAVVHGVAKQQAFWLRVAITFTGTGTTPVITSAEPTATWGTPPDWNTDPYFQVFYIGFSEFALRWTYRGATNPDPTPQLQVVSGLSFVTGVVNTGYVDGGPGGNVFSDWGFYLRNSAGNRVQPSDTDKIILTLTLNTP